jgi:hypothetical protein
MKYALFVLFFLACHYLFGQADTIYTFNKTIVGKVKEIGHQEVLYCLPNEDLVYRLRVRSVLSISFGNGRKEVFNERKNLNIVNTSENWEKVELTTNPDEVVGMNKLDFISVKATGATVYSSVTNTQDRAFRKMKQAAAIMGGNVVLLNNQSVEGAIYSERTTRTQLTGTIYLSFPKDTTGLVKNICYGDFVLASRKSMGVNNAAPSPDYLGELVIRIRTGGKQHLDFSNGVYRISLPQHAAIPKGQGIITSHSPKQFIVGYHEKNRFYELVFVRKS